MNYLFASNVAIYSILLFFVFKKSFFLIRETQKKNQITNVLTKKETTITSLMWVYVFITNVVIFTYGKINSGSHIWEGIINGILSTLFLLLKPRRLFVIGVYFFLLIKQNNIK